MKTIEELNRTAREFEKSEADSAIKLRREAHRRKIIKGLQAKVAQLEEEIVALKNTNKHQRHHRANPYKSRLHFD